MGHFLTVDVGGFVQEQRSGVQDTQIDHRFKHVRFHANARFKRFHGQHDLSNEANKRDERHENIDEIKDYLPKGFFGGP